MINWARGKSNKSDLKYACLVSAFEGSFFRELALPKAKPTTLLQLSNGN
jgi:hypothetical protein